MSRNIPEPDPYSEFEDEGIPDLQDGTPGQERAVDPQQAPLPGDRPQAADDFGTTAEEQAEGEPLDLRTAREVPEDQAMSGDEGEPADWGAQPEEPSGQVWDEPRPSGRLVAPDQGAHPDEEKDAVAGEAGPDAGGYSAEESAMRVEPE
ncbi:MAG: hypothetical protein J2P25_15605 [Nocardiopsaceae bacterium]|nr:hypothetical protein [Nocardiopsaceae bacterium]